VLLAAPAPPAGDSMALRVTIPEPGPLIGCF
jgi:hypothetical protein